MWFLASASAHVGQAVAGVDVLAAPAGLEIEATYGYLLPEPAGGWGWVCHEALTEPGAVKSPRYAHGGAFLGWVSDERQGLGGATLFRSTVGCDWDPVPSLAGETVLEATFDPTDPRVALAVTAGRLYRSDDTGLSFAPLEPTADRRFRSARVRAGRIAAVATDPDRTAAFLLEGDGVTWTETPLPARPAPIDGRVVGLDDLGVDLVLDPVGADTVLRGVGGVVDVVRDAPGAVTDVLRDGDRVWIVQDGTTLVSVTDGLTSDHEAFPLGFGLTLDGDALVTVPQSWAVGSLVSRSGDRAVSFAIEAYPDDIVGPRTCPADSDVGRVCVPLWGVLEPDLRGYDDPAPVDTGGPDLPDPDRPEPDPTGDTAEPAPEPVRDHRDGTKGCGCASGGGAGWLGVPAWLVVRRRRRR